MQDKKIGVIGGSGLYEMKDLKIKETKRISTPYGNPSDEFIIGELFGKTLIFLPRHARGHKILPTEINFRANIMAMKLLGVERIISVSAVGSMKEKIVPGDIVIPNQFIDWTRQRTNTFFGNGIVAHVSLADPICPCLSDVIYTAGKNAGAVVHKGGTYICIEGPQFSTRAESLMYRQWGVDVIGMTNVNEVKLAREAEICYATIALATDYDCWHEAEESVTADMVIGIIKKNVTMAQEIIKEAVRLLDDNKTTFSCKCGTALKDAILTSKGMIPQETKERLFPIIGKYIN